MDVDTDGKTVGDIVIYGGCPGQAKALPKLVKGMTLDEAIKRLRGVNCRRGTSCADQLGRILEREKEDYGDVIIVEPTRIKTPKHKHSKDCEDDDCD